MTDIAERYRALAAELTRRIDAVPDERWDDPSPCAGWTAKDVLRHIVTTHGAMPGYAGLSLDLERSVDADPAGAWVEARDNMQALLEDPVRADTEYDGYFGRTTLAATVDRFLGLDLLIHGWDLARATGQDETLPAEHVHRVYTDALGLGANLRTKGVCGPAVPVPDDASEQDRLLGLLGRTP
jgi:uncharacterized protein (TIGR03086 family)